MKNGLYLSIAFLLLASAAQAQTTPKPLPGYTYKIETGAAGKQVYVSAQRPFNANGDLVGAGNLEVQTQQVFENLKTALGQVSMTLNDVTQITYHLKGIEGKVDALASQQVSNVGTLNFAQTVTPKITQVKSIPQIVQDNSILVEIEVVAVK